MSQRKVMIIGLDALTLDLVRPWVDEGRLPNLSRFMREGAWGPLQSTVPPMSPAAWSTFATGVNPGKHGIINFFQFKPDSYEAYFVNAANRHGVTFWEIAGQQGIPGGILNVPVTYPPRPYNGFIVSGVLSPGVTERMASPPEVFTDLLACSPDYSVDVDLLKTQRGDIRLQFLERSLKVLEARLKAALGLYRKYRPPLFCVVFVEADRICHFFWHHHELARQGRLLTEMDQRMGRAILEVYEALDKAVGILISEAHTDTDFILLSDHGAGPILKSLNMNKVLARAGLLTERRQGPFGRLKQRAIWKFAGVVPISFKQRLKGWLPGISGRAIRFVTTAAIDFSRTQAFPVVEADCVFVNVKGRQPQGIVEPGAEYEAVRDRVIEAFESLTDPETGERVVSKAYRREELWSGPCLEQLPDVVIEQAVNRYATLLREQFLRKDEIFCQLPVSDSRLYRSGLHRRNGLIMAMGPQISRCEIRHAEIADVPATILALLGCTIPGSFDGRVLTEMLADDLQGVSTIDAGMPDTTAREDGFSESEREAIERRLKGLGYL